MIGGGVKLRLGFEPNACCLMLGMGGPAAGEQKIDVEQPVHGDSSRSWRTRSGVMGGAPLGAWSKQSEALLMGRAWLRALRDLEDKERMSFSLSTGGRFLAAVSISVNDFIAES